MRQHLQDDVSIQLNTQIQLRYETEGPERISKEFGVSPGTVSSRATKLGLKSLNKSRRATFRAAQSRSLNNSRLNTDFFASPLTEKSAYILGYIWADGGIYGDKLKFECKREDRVLLVALKEILEADQPISDRSQIMKSGTVSDTSTLQLSSRPLVQSLIIRGIIYAKSKFDPPLPELCDANFRHFVRGLFDGDGSTYHRDGVYLGVSLYGTKTVMTQIVERITALLSLKAKKVSAKYEGCKTYQVHWQNKECATKLANWFYTSATVLLPRKYKILLPYLTAETRASMNLMTCLEQTADATPPE